MSDRAQKLRPARNEARGFLRPLGAAEQFFHLYAQVYPVHFSLCAEIDGAIRAAVIRSALDAASNRHPILRSRVVTDNRSGSAFHKADWSFEPRIIYAGKDADWRRTVENELKNPMSASDACPLRTTVLRTSEGTAIMMTFHHAFADGRSGICVFHDFMRALAGEKLEAFETFPPLEEKMLEPSPISAGGDGCEIELTSPIEQSGEILADLRTNIDTAELSKDETARLIAQCRTNGTTVNNLICAVAARQVSLRGKKVVRITTPFDLRKLADIDTGACGVFIAGATTELRIKANSPAWDDAKRIGMSLAEVRSYEAATALLKEMSNTFSPTSGPETFHAFVSSRAQTDVVVSNLGVLPLETRYGDYVIKAVWAPAMQTNLPKDRQTLGVSTFGGQLRIVHQSYDPIPNFAAAIREALITTA